MADSAPAATNTARAIRSIPLSAPVESGFTTLVFMSAIPLKSNFLVVAIVEHSNQKRADLGHSSLAAVSLVRPPIAHDAGETAASELSRRLGPRNSVPDQTHFPTALVIANKRQVQRYPLRLASNPAM